MPLNVLAVYAADTFGPWGFLELTTLEAPVRAIESAPGEPVVCHSPFPSLGEAHIPDFDA